MFFHQAQQFFTKYSFSPSAVLYLLTNRILQSTPGCLVRLAGGWDEPRDRFFMMSVFFFIIREDDMLLSIPLGGCFSRPTASVCRCEVPVQRNFMYSGLFYDVAEVLGDMFALP